MAYRPRSSRRLRALRSSPTPRRCTLGAIGLVDRARRRSPRARTSGPRRRPAWPLAAALLALIPASELAIARRPAPRRRARRRRAGSRGSTSARAFPRARGRWSSCPTLLGSVGGRRAAARAPRGAGPREPRPARPLRDPERLPGRACRGDAGRRRDPRRRAWPGSRRSTAATRRGRGTASSSSTASAVEPERRRLHGLGAEAREDRGVQPPAARQPRGRRLPGAGRGRCRSSRRSATS